MKALVVRGVNKVAVEEVPDPEISNDEVLIKVRVCGLCGTDFHIVRHGHGAVSVKYPIIPGHELSGEVVAVGKKVRGFKHGDRVVVDPTVFCGNCWFCRNKRYNLCLNVEGIGTTMPGGFAEYVAARESNLYPVEYPLSFEEAAFAEPLACVVHGLRLIGPSIGDSVLIFGAGPIGNLLLQLFLHSGAAMVAVIDKIKSRLRMAEDCGASITILAKEDFQEKLLSLQPLGFDVVIDATGNPEIVQSTIRFVKRGGKILLFGVCPLESSIILSPHEVYKREVKIIGSFAEAGEVGIALDLLKAGIVNVKPLVSHRLDLEEAARILLGKEIPGSLKIQVQFL